MTLASLPILKPKLVLQFMIHMSTKSNFEFVVYVHMKLLTGVNSQQLNANWLLNNKIERHRVMYWLKRSKEKACSLGHNIAYTFKRFDTRLLLHCSMYLVYVSKYEKA